MFDRFFINSKFSVQIFRLVSVSAPTKCVLSSYPYQDLIQPSAVACSNTSSSAFPSIEPHTQWYPVQPTIKRTSVHQNLCKCLWSVVNDFRHLSVHLQLPASNLQSDQLCHLKNSFYPIKKMSYCIRLLHHLLPFQKIYPLRNQTRCGDRGDEVVTCRLS